MKKSNIYILINTFLLVLAGVAATKVNVYGSIQAVYFTLGGKFVVPVGLAGCNVRDQNEGVCLYETSGGIPVVLFTAIQHKHPLYVDPT